MKEEIHTALTDSEFFSRPVSELQRLAKRLVKSPDLIGRAPVQCRIAVLSSFTTDYLVELLPLILMRQGIGGVIYQAPYGAMITEILDFESGYHSFKPQVTFILPSHRDLDHQPAIGAPAQAVQAAIQSELEIWNRVWQHIQTPIVQLTFDPPPFRPLGEADGLSAGGLLHHVRAINLNMSDDAPNHVCLIDAENLASRIGLDDWHDNRLYRLTKQPFAMAALPVLADSLATSAVAALGRSRKVLVMDLDGTLWGGAVGDVGVEGIELGQDTPDGESFIAFQAYIKSLKGRGVILAVCSKNQEDSARAPFLQHPEMVLQLDDISYFAANFDDKAQNIRTIARRLNVDTSAILFIDDSPVESAWVRKMLPEVQVLHLSGDPAEFTARLDALQPFPTSRLTEEDLARSASYGAVLQTSKGIANSDDIDSFLRDLAPQVTIESATEETVDRLTQLIAKTNQFKMNRRTFSPSELMADHGHVVAIRFKDRLQDYGIVAVVVMQIQDESLVIQNWVMSCRVFSRRLEYFTRSIIGNIAFKAHAKSLQLVYTESKKNKFLGDVLPLMGFSYVEEKDIFESMATAPIDMLDSFITLD